MRHCNTSAQSPHQGGQVFPCQAFSDLPGLQPCRNYHSYRYNEAAKIAGLGSRMCKFVRDVEKHPKDDGDQAWQHRESARFSHQSASPETGIGTGAGNLEAKLGIRHAVLAQPDLLACKCATGPKHSNLALSNVAQPGRRWLFPFLFSFHVRNLALPGSPSNTTSTQMMVF